MMNRIKNIGMFLFLLVPILVNAQSMIYDPYVEINTGANKLLIRSIEFTKEYTVVNIRYNNSGGWGWIRTGRPGSKDAFYIADKYGERLTELIKAKNISYAPKKTKLRSTSDIVDFSLIFGPIKSGIKRIDIIEGDPNESSGFHFYGVHLYDRNAINNRNEDIVVSDKLMDNAVEIEKEPDIIIDVDVEIPITEVKQTHTYALIIGNEDYKSRQKDLSDEQNVDFAENDAQVFSKYCEKTLGIPQKQIKVLINASSAEIYQGLAWINNLSRIEHGNAKLIFYYSGHGLPNEQTKEAHIIPVDVSSANLDYAIKVKDVYKKLAEHPSKQVTVFLDACFSGGARNQGLIAMKGVRIKPKESNISGNLVIFSSSTGNESSAVFREKHHGYFTYFLLKKLKDSKGEVAYESLGNYIIQSVSKETGLIGKIQTPEINVSPKVKNEWKAWKLK